MKKRFFRSSLVLTCLIVSTNVLWATHSGTHYFKGEAIAVNSNSGSGKVYIAYGADDINEVGDVPEWGDTYIVNTNCDGGSEDHKPYTLCAKPDAGSYFWGWYTDPSCTEGSIIYYDSDDDYYEDSGTEKYPIFKGMTPGKESTNEEEPAEQVFYAKFSSKQCYRYYATLNILTGNNEQGLVTYSNNIVGGYAISSDLYYFNESALGYEKYPGILPLTENSTGISSRIHVLAEPARGFVFDHWEITPSTNTSVASSDQYEYSTTKAITAFDVFTTSQDKDNPQMGEITAHFRAASTTSVTVKKLAARGTVTARVGYKEIYDSNGKPKIHFAESDLETMNASENTKTYADLFEGDSLKLTATPEEGYKFYGWYKVNGNNEKTIVSSELTLAVDAFDADTYFAYFDNFESANFRVGFTGCNTFEEALSAADHESSKTIYVQKNCTIPAGNYTIPEGVTLLIPYSENHISTKLVVDRQVNKSNAVPTDPYCTLTLAGRTVLNVYGAIEVGGLQYVGGNAKTEGYLKGTGRPGAYGQLIMGDNSSIILNNGARLRAWGYITGTGSIDARRGAIVYEQFQVMDWKGGSNALSMMDNSQKVFPVNQYFIQNIEVATLYRPGARLFTSMSACNDGGTTSGVADNVQIIGVGNRRDGEDDDIAMFLMDDNDDSEDSWVRKSYDVENDKQIYDINNSAHLNGITISLPAFGVTLTSSNYNLPITNNMKIHLLSGKMDITQDVVLLPGAEMQVDKLSTMIINAGKSLYLYDLEQWDKYAYPTSYTKQVPFRPGGVQERPALVDATINVRGTFEVKGAIYTTTGGANIYSTINDAGTILYSTNAPTESKDVYQWKDGGTYVAAECTSAQLVNEDGSFKGTFTQTAGTEAGQSYCFIDMDEDGHGEWISLTDDEDLCMTHDQNGIYYIKPGAYVPISVGEPSPEADNTYRDHYAGTDSIYIVTGECQWWCVYPVEGHPDLFECKHKDNHTFYYYDEDNGWIEKKFKVEWVNWNGDPVKYWPTEGRSGHPEDSLNYYMMTYGSHPQWLSANPTHPEDDAHTYAFSGWSPAITEETIVTSDITYTATFEERDRMYAISFLDSDDDLIELVYCKLGDVPTCSRYTLQETETTKEVWSPAIGAVTKNGTRTYKVTETDKEETGPFTILFVNWDGTSLQKFDGVENAKVVKNSNPVYSGSDPTKVVEGDILHTYTFAGWKAADGTVYAKNETLPAATTDATYTANFSQGEKEYTITFYKKDGTTQVGEPQSVKYGVVPTEPSSELIWYFKEGKEWDSTLVWSPLVSAVTANQNYRATYTRKKHQYTVNWVDGNGTTIASNYVDYGATPAYSGQEPTKASDATYAYIFTGDWNTAPDGSGTGIVAVSGNATYYAQFNGNIRAVTVSGNESADEDKAFETLTITTIGQLDMGSNKLKVDELILKASETTSGQLKGSNVTATNAYYDIKFTNGERRHWHSFGVPWQINLDTDPLREVETGRTFVLGRDYDIMYYNGAKRAANGPGANCWEYVEHNSHILQPGQGYMIAFTSDIQTIRFAKKAYAPVVFSGTVNVPANAGGEATDNGINAIANPMTYYASLSVAGVGQVHDGGEIGHDEYTEYNLSDPFVVGKAVYVQVTSGQTLTPSSGISPAAAPVRRAAKATDKEYLSLNDFYTVSLTNANSQEAKVYVLPEEDKEEEYVIGHDLVKMGMSDRKPQIWIKRYDVNLGLNTTAPVNDVAEFPVNIYAPKAGQYTLSLVSEPDDDYIVYLTLNGEAIWNLSDEAYTLNLAAGTNKSYGLRLSARKSPSVATGIDEAVLDAQGEIKKVIINDQVFIIRGNQVYSIDGQLVK